MKAWSRCRPWKKKGPSFGARLLLTLTLTLFVTGAFQYTLISRQFHDYLLDEAAARARSDTILVQQAFDSEANTTQRIQVINQRLTAISKRSGVRYVVLVDRFGIVNNSNDPALIGQYRGSSEVQQVLRSNQVVTSVLRDDGIPYYRYRVPVDIETGRFVLEVEQNAQSEEGKLAHAKQSSLLVAATGVLIGIGLFFLLGGRTLSRVYRRAERMSTRDGLTGLENHITFNEAMEHMVALAQRQETPLSLALIDVDDFKLVNDRLGHRLGDEVIKQVAAILSEQRKSDRVFRVGGDEFAVLFPATDSDEASVATQRLWQTALSDLDGVTLSIGVASFTTDMTAADLHDHADHALYEAKRRGRNTVVSFEEVRDDAVFSSSKVRSVRQMLEDEEMGIAFQPIWDLHGARPLGFESLARPLTHYGLTGPGEMFQIGEMLSRTHHQDALAWKMALERSASLPEDILLFLNVSPFTVDKGDEPVDRLIEIVNASGRRPSSIVVEITERWSTRRDIVIAQAERLRAAGFQLALDDVGAASGDLNMLSRLPVDFVKVDLSVVKAARTDSSARGVFFAIAGFASHSGCTVIAEGIEDESVLAFVQSAGEHLATNTTIRGGQGYFLGVPVEGTPKVTAAPYRPFTTDEDRILT
jgi:diguanylate cyclase (GGDEF)-like protein